MHDVEQCMMQIQLQCTAVLLQYVQYSVLYVHVGTYNYVIIVSDCLCMHAG